MKTTILYIMLHMGSHPHHHPHNGSYTELGIRLAGFVFALLIIAVIVYSPTDSNKK